jgi:hypothetical protein
MSAILLSCQKYYCHVTNITVMSAILLTLCGAENGVVNLQQVRGNKSFKVAGGGGGADGRCIVMKWRALRWGRVG